MIIFKYRIWKIEGVDKEFNYPISLVNALFANDKELVPDYMTTPLMLSDSFDIPKVGYNILSELYFIESMNNVDDMKECTPLDRSLSHLQILADKQMSVLKEIYDICGKIPNVNQVVFFTYKSKLIYVCASNTEYVDVEKYFCSHLPGVHIEFYDTSVFNPYSDSNKPYFKR